MSNKTGKNESMTGTANPDLSIIIAHYNNEGHCHNVLTKLLKSISAQTSDIQYEILIADDGSPENRSFFIDKSPERETERGILKFVSAPPGELTDRYGLEELIPDGWAYYQKSDPFLGKAAVMNLCIQKSRGSYLFFLDDDNILTDVTALSSLMNLFQKGYDLVIGQIRDRNGRLRSYDSHRVQGTTLGIRRELMMKAGIFGEWTEDIGCAIDSDLWWKLFQLHAMVPYRAVFTEAVRSFDSCSGRWKKHINVIFKDMRARRAFFSRYSLKNYKSSSHNLSRRKELWIEKG